MKSDPNDDFGEFFRKFNEENEEEKKREERRQRFIKSVWAILTGLGVIVGFIFAFLIIPLFPFFLWGFAAKAGGALFDSIGNFIAYLFDLIFP